MSARPEIAVIISTRGRPALLQRCLGALIAQRLDAELFEVIVVDDGPDAATREVVAELAARAGGAPAFRYLVNVGSPGPAGARNQGWKATAAPLVAFTDDAAVPQRPWLYEGQQAMGADLAAAVGRIEVPLDGPPTDHARNAQRLASAEFVTANLFVAREALWRVGGFDERFHRAWRDDSDLQFSLLATGAVIGRAPEAVVLCPVRPAPWGHSMSEQANVVFDALLYRKHPKLFVERIRRRPPWHYIAIVGLTFACLAAAMLGHGRMAAWCGLGAAGGVLAFAMYRLKGASLAPAHVAEMLVTSCAIPFLALFWRAVGMWRYRVLFP